MKCEMFNVKCFLMAAGLLVSTSAFSQQYKGMSGLIHIPTAEMSKAGDARIGAHWVGKEHIPSSMKYQGENYDTYTYYLNITPFSWIEGAYTCIAMKGNEGRFNHKDRHFSLKVRPLKEGKYHPAIAIGSDDFFSDNLGAGDEGMNANHFTCYWGSAVKHVDLNGHEIAAHVGYRYYKQEENKQYQGVNAAVTYRPALSDKTKRIIQPRLIAEYDGHSLNLGADALLWRHFLLQVSCDHLKGFSTGLCYQINLLGKNKENNIQ